MLLVTFFTTTTLGAGWSESDGPAMLLTPSMVARVWGDPQLLGLGLAFSLPALFILFCHEMGHYLACRAYRLPATLPHFLPAPVGIGSFGAFIRIRAPIRSKRQLFDVGIAGPLAGFVALVPFLLLGVALSEPAPVDSFSADPSEPQPVLGPSLAMVGAIRLFHGPLAEGMGVDLHPFAFAAWFGLLATALNLLPLGQLDGGHILYAVTGRLQRLVALPLWSGLALMGVFFWPGWVLWALITLVVGLRHPPVHDEEEPLGRGRRWLAWAALAMLLLSFMPVPVGFVTGS